MTLVLPLTSYHSLAGSAPRHDDSPPDWAPAPQPTFTGPPRRCDSPVMTASRARPASRPMTSSASPRPTSLSPLKRKQDFEVSPIEPRPKRISPFLNTPKQRRDELRKVLRLSANKFRQIEDHETCLRKVVLINNTVRRLERQWFDDKRRSSAPSYCPRFLSTDHLLETDEASRKRHSVCDFDFVGNSPLSSPPTALLDDFRNTSCAAQSDTSDDDMIVDALTRTLDDSDSDDSLPSPTNENQSLMDSLSSCSPPSPPTSSPCSYSMTSSSAVSMTSSDTSFSSSSSTRTTTSPSCPVVTSQSSSQSDEEDNSMSERDRLILGQMDIVFNNLISVLSEAAV